MGAVVGTPVENEDSWAPRAHRVAESDLLECLNSAFVTGGLDDVGTQQSKPCCSELVWSPPRAHVLLRQAALQCACVPGCICGAGPAAARSSRGTEEMLCSPRSLKAAIGGGHKETRQLLVSHFLQVSTGPSSAILLLVSPGHGAPHPMEGSIFKRKYSKLVGTGR